MLVNRLNSHKNSSSSSRDWQRGTYFQTDHRAQTDWFKDCLLQCSARQERRWVDELRGETDCSLGSVRLFLHCFLSVTESGAACGNKKISTYAFSVWLLYFLPHLWFLQIFNDRNFCGFCLLERWIMAVLVLVYRVSRDLSEKWYTFFNISFLLDFLFSFSFEKW